MANEFFIKRGDSLPVVRAELSDADGAINISGATVNFIYTKRPDGTPVTGSASIVSAVSGLVQFDWPTGAGSIVEKGVYEAEWKATFSNGDRMSFPNDSFLLFEIIEHV